MTHREVEVTRPTPEEAEQGIEMVGRIETPCGSSVRMEREDSSWRLVFSHGGMFTPKEGMQPAPPPPPAVLNALMIAAAHLDANEVLDSACADIAQEPDRDAPPV